MQKTATPQRPEAGDKQLKRITPTLDEILSEPWLREVYQTDSAAFEAKRRAARLGAIKNQARVIHHRHPHQTLKGGALYCVRHSLEDVVGFGFSIMKASCVERCSRLAANT